jgi:hypothetical protein
MNSPAVRSHRSSLKKSVANGSVRDSNADDGPPQEDIVNLEINNNPSKVDAALNLNVSTSKKDNNIMRDSFAEEENDEE